MTVHTDKTSLAHIKYILETIGKPISFCDILWIVNRVNFHTMEQHCVRYIDYKSILGIYYADMSSIEADSYKMVNYKKYLSDYSIWMCNKIIRRWKLYGRFFIR